jgi:hypothetical protein
MQMRGKLQGMSLFEPDFPGTQFSCLLKEALCSTCFLRDRSILSIFFFNWVARFNLLKIVRLGA